MIHLKRYFLFVFTVLSVALAMQGASLRIQVSPYPGRNSINVGDKFYVIVKLDEVPGDPIELSNSLQNFDVPGASIVYNNSSAQSLNGIMKGECTMVCRADRNGTFTVGPMSVGRVRSNAVRYTVGTGPSASRQSQQMSQNAPDPRQASGSGPRFIGKGNGNLFMRATVSKTNAYEQEALVYTVKLYCSYARIKFVGATASPKFEGFVVEESQETDRMFHRESFEGREYNTAVVARYIIFPQMTGSLNVTGNTYTVSVDEREYYRDEYFGSMTVSRPLQLNVTPNDLKVNVRALPQPKPADFSGGVGKFSIASRMANTHLKTGETAQIVYTVSGTGNLKYVTMPDLALSYPKQLEVYSPQTDVKTNVGASSVSGTIKFDYSLMPDEEGDYRIPDVTLVYFNPETGSYEKSVAKGYNVTVGKGSSSARSQKKQRAVFDAQLMPVSVGVAGAAPYVCTFTYWLWFIIPVIILLTAVICYRKYLKDNADFSAVMSRKANKMARRRLRKAAVCMGKNDSTHFYDEMLFALWGYISYKMKIPTSELTRENIADVLAKTQVSQQTIDHFIDLLDMCEYAKYSPAADASNKMHEVYDNGVEVINNLEESFKKIKK